MFELKIFDKQSMNTIKKFFTKFEANSLQLDPKNDEWKSPNHNGDNVNYTRTELGKKIYTITRLFLDKNQDNLSPQEKGIVLKDYIELWKKTQCILDIKDTEYSEAHKGSVFGKYRSRYENSNPMVAGFNLSQAILGNLDFSDLIFLSTNFKGADFSGANLCYSHFRNCDLSKIKAGNAIFNQGVFTNCNLQDANLEQAKLNESQFEYCDIQRTKFNEDTKQWLNLDHCKEENIKQEP